MLRTRIALELGVDLTVAGALTGELVHERAYCARDDDLEAGHAPSLRERPDRSGRGQSSGPKSGPGVAETKSPSRIAARPGP